MVPPDPLTRRQAIALGASAGLGALALPGVARAAAGGGVRSFTMDVRGVGTGAGPVLTAPEDFDLLGLRGVGVGAAGLEVRARPVGGAWSRWTPLAGQADHGPDHGDPAGATDPVWTGRARELQLRAARRLGPVRIHLLRVPRSAGAAARARAAAAGRPAIVLREDWGGDTVKPRAAPSYGRVDLAFVHHTETSNAYSPDEAAAIVLGVARFHRDTNGWNDIGYNFFVDRYGTIYEGRAGGIEKAVIGAQAQGYNSFSTGISCIGSFMGTSLPEAALDSLCRLIAWKLPLHGTPVSGTVTVTSGGGVLNAHPYGAKVTMHRIAGHRDGDSTDCPGDRLYGQLPEIRRRVARLAGQVTPPPADAGSMTLSADALTVTYGDAAMVRGVLTDAAGTALDGVRVALQKRGPSGSWITMNTVTTGRDGAFSGPMTWRSAGSVRARARAAGQTITSPEVAIALLPRVTIRALPARIPAGALLVVRGAVAPSRSVQVRVERRDVSGVWAVVSGRSVRTPRSGSVKASVRLPAAGRYRVSLVAGRAATAPVYVRATGGGTTGGAPTA